MATLEAVMNLPHLMRARIAASIRAQADGLSDAASIRATPEFQQLFALMAEDEDIRRIFPEESLTAWLAMVVGATDVDHATIGFRGIPSIGDDFLHILVSEEDVVDMRATLATGQIWLRYDVIPRDKLPLAAAFAQRQRVRFDLPLRPRGRPPGRARKWAKFERSVNPSLPDEVVWYLLVNAGLVTGLFASEDPDEAESRYQLVQKVKRNARKAQNDRAGG